MSIVWKEVVKRPKVCLMLLVEMLLSILDKWLVLEVARLGALVFDSRGSREVIWDMIVVMLLLVPVNMVQRKMATHIHEMYTGLTNTVIDKVIDGEFHMYIEWSPSRVTTIQESLWNIAGATSAFRRTVSIVSRIILTLIAIARVRVELLIPTAGVYFIVAVVLRKIGKKWHEIDDAADNLKDSRNAELDMVINGFKEVRGFSTQEYHRESLYDQNRNTLALFKKRQKYGMAITAIYKSLNLITTVGTTAYMMAVWSAGECSVATALLVVGYATSIIDPLEQIIDLIDEMSYRLSKVGRYKEFMEYKNKYSTQRDLLRVDGIDSIRFENVTFMYNTEMSVFEKFNLSIRKGQKVGICGPSGEGKTTLLNLIMHYYEPSEGRVLVNELDYTYIDARSLRKKIGIINQDTYIFDRSIRYNIAYGKVGATDYQVMEAAKKAGIYKFITNLPEGLDTVVGPKGLKLSGGQKQRIGLARLFLSDPEVILLDEATASLDNESEWIVQNALNKLSDKTIITIAHRLSTIQNSDVIYVIQDHKVSEQGTHEELMKLGGWYAKWNPSDAYDEE